MYMLCIRIYTHIYIYVYYLLCTYIYRHISKYIYTHIHMRTPAPAAPTPPAFCGCCVLCCGCCVLCWLPYLSAYIYIYIYIHTHTYTSIYYIYIYICMLYIFIHIYIYIYIEREREREREEREMPVYFGFICSCLFGWHNLSNPTCLIRPRLCCALCMVSRITIICQHVRHL